MDDRATVMPVKFAGDQMSLPRKIRPTGPSMPAGSIVHVEVDERWVKTRVLRIEFAVLHVEAAA
jgi:hypothetical protein